MVTYSYRECLLHNFDLKSNSILSFDLRKYFISHLSTYFGKACLYLPALVKKETNNSKHTKQIPAKQTTKFDPPLSVYS